MFRKILIANRGEIACRINKTCRRLGIATVAVYSTADKDAAHVKLADEAYLVGNAPPKESYLNLERILQVARDCGADAVHPGYGFLSENPDFARRCQEEGISFIGPSPSVMEKMGDKLKARKLAKRAGLPVLPATDQAIADHEAVDKAQELGFPLMVKAAAGGGGIGIHVVNSMEGLLPILERTRQVAEYAFGSPRIYLERYLGSASHIEVQLIGDQHGNLVHLNERDCSIQRRNQKLIEETPASKLTPKLRRKICELALKFGRYIGYTNAGTVEFLVSREHQVYFMEMNTRLQVEHGVTEMVTGLDVVELQIRAALGEPLPIGQPDVACIGHAIEARVYPEDPETFLPKAGVVSDFNLPTGENIRVDTALFNGYEVTLHYEPLLAKVISWGPDRKQAIKGLLRALLEFRLEGLDSNLPLLREMVLHKEFACGAYHTGSLPQWLKDNFKASRRRGDSHRMQSQDQAGDDREKAAAIGVALALALGSEVQPNVPQRLPRPSQWRASGRREQFLSRAMSQGGWR